MESIELAAALRRAGDSCAPDDHAAWCKVIGPLLTPEPLTPAFLEEALAPLPGLGKAYVLETLALLGRGEIADHAAGLASREADGSVRLFLAETLLRLKDPRAYVLLEDLRRYSLEHPLGDPGSVPLEWISEVLREK